LKFNMIINKPYQITFSFIYLLFISNLSMFEKEIIIDGRGHMVGRLASKVAKELLRGQRVVVVRCEQLVLSGSLFRNNLKFHEFLGKSNNSNPRRNFKHFRSPARMFWRSLRGMLPHKELRGAAALNSLKVFEGIPYPYDQRKRMVVPEALKVLRLKATRDSCILGDLAAKVGWTKAETVATLEAKRKVKSEKFFQNKQKKVVARRTAMGDKKVAAVNAELAKHGF
jgi:large subunit ribosomal protein L13Ae